MSTEAFEKWLDDTAELIEPNAEQLAHARLVLSSEGMRVIWGLLVASAQAKRIELENAPCGNAEQAHRVGVIQGSIKGIYMIRDTLLELANMGSQPAAPEEEQRYG